jgi:enamine deaminase RidA (YjgF/YER057c/UK114 family)
VAVGDRYSQAVTAGGVLYCAGQIGMKPGESLGAELGDISAQTEQACRNLVMVLRAGGCEPRDVLKTTVFLADIEDFTACAHRSTNAICGCSGLSRAQPLNCLISRNQTWIRHGVG